MLRIVAFGSNVAMGKVQVVIPNNLNLRNVSVSNISQIVYSNCTDYFLLRVDNCSGFLAISQNSF